MPYPDSVYPSILRGKDKRESQRLLAAAPDLLNALHGVLHWAECECDELENVGDDLPCDYCVALKAIAKAEGRSE